METSECYSMTLIGVTSDCRLSDGAVRVYNALATFCRGGDKRTAWPSAETLAGLSCRCVRSVKYAVRELEKTGWLAVHRRTGNSSIYSLPVQPAAPLPVQLVAPNQSGKEEEKEEYTRATAAACGAATVARSGQPDPDPETDAVLPISEQIAQWRGLADALAAGKRAAQA